VQDAQRYGRVEVDIDGRVTGFTEKTARRAPGLVNAGVYVFNRAVLDHLPEATASLERDVVPRLLDQGVYALKMHGMFIDIGTPEDYARAQTLYVRLRNEALQSGTACR
jgi:NDP-sugar pyrophosphorylase family protein